MLLGEKTHQLEKKKMSLNLTRTLVRSTTNLQEVEESEERVKQHHGAAVHKIESGGNSAGQAA